MRQPAYRSRKGGRCGAQGRLKISTRSLNMSLTYSLPANTSRWPGASNCPCAVPSEPNVWSTAPAALNSTRRLAAVSATQTLPPESIATPSQLCSLPTPMVPSWLPSASDSFTIRSWLVSATYTVPPETATSLGVWKPPWLHTSVGVPTVFQSWMRLLRVSATTTPVGVAATALTRRNWPSAVPCVPKNLPVGSPSRVNSSMRPFLVSVNHTLLGSVFSMAMSRGQLSPLRSLPQPRWPKCSCHTPEALNRCMRWFTLSATKMLFASTATPVASLNLSWTAGTPA